MREREREREGDRQKEIRERDRGRRDGEMERWRDKVGITDKMKRYGGKDKDKCKG